MPKQYTEEFKKIAVQRFVTDESIPAICKDLQVAPSTFYRWIKLYHSIESEHHSYSPLEFDAISRRLVKAEHQLEIIRLTEIISKTPLQIRLCSLTQIHEQREQFSIHDLCDALEVSRGTFYNHIFRKADQTHRLREQAELLLQVQQAFDDSGQRFGAEKIRIVLAESGIHISKKRISSIMQELNLQSVRSDAKKEYMKREAYKKQNLLNRDFYAERPNQIWVSDITYFKGDNYRIYLCAIIDLFSRRVVGYKISQNCSTNLVTATFKKAFNSRGTPSNLTFHSDRGAQYTSAAFTSLLRQCGVAQSFSASGRPHDNAVAETFFANFKKEEAYRHSYSSEQDFRKSTDTYIHFYNEIRPHMTLAYKTPIHFEELYG